MPGKFYVLEGADRVGKSTQVVKLVEELGGVHYKFPNRTTATGQVINDVLQGRLRMRNEALFFLFMSNIAEQTDQIAKDLVSGKTVIADRYYYSTIAYGMANGMDLRASTILNLNLPRPDKVFYLHCEVSDLLARENFGEELYEDSIMMRKVTDNFSFFEQTQNNWFKIDASVPPDHVFQQILRCIKVF